MAAQQAGERRLRALCPEPGHRQWVAPPSADLSCTLCDEPFSRETAREVCAHCAYSVACSSALPPVGHASVRPHLLPGLHARLVHRRQQSVSFWSLRSQQGRQVRSGECTADVLPLTSLACADLPNWGPTSCCSTWWTSCASTVASGCARRETESGRRTRKAAPPSCRWTRRLLTRPPAASLWCAANFLDAGWSCGAAPWTRTTRQRRCGTRVGSEKQGWLLRHEARHVLRLSRRVTLREMMQKRGAQPDLRRWKQRLPFCTLERRDFVLRPLPSSPLKQSMPSGRSSALWKGIQTVCEVVHSVTILCLLPLRAMTRR